MMRLAVIAEDLGLPLDEGAKKTSSCVIRSFIKAGVNIDVFTRSENPCIENTRPLPKNKFLLSPSFFQDIRGRAPDGILYIPESSGTLNAFLRAAILKLATGGRPTALLNLQYRDLPPAARLAGMGRWVDVVFAQSKTSQEVLQRIGCRTVLLPGGVDGTSFHPAGAEEKRLLREKYGIPATCQVVLHVGHLKDQRNVGALTRLAKAGYLVVLVASTSTKADPGLKEELAKAGVMVVTGFVQDIQHFYQLADCYLFPVVHITSAIDAPLSVLEAMACNIPVASTPYGALPAMFRPGNGLAFFETEEEIGQAVRKAIADPDCRTGDMAAPYSWDNLAAMMLETMQKVGYQ